MPPGPDDHHYSSREVQDAAGLTPRQVNDWDSRGMLPHGREGKGKWRRFSSRDLFALAVCAEIRRQFGTPVERLKWVQEFMLQEKANHLEAAIDLMTTLGVGVWLLTDFEQTFIMDSELEFTDLWQYGYFGPKREKSFVLLPIDTLVNRLLACLKKPIHLEAHGRGYEIMGSARAMDRVRSPEELLVLEKIRSGEFTRVEVETLDGEIATIRTTSRPDPGTRFEALLDKPYQSLKLTTKDGKIVSIVQEVTTKPRRASR